MKMGVSAIDHIVIDVETKYLSSDLPGGWGDLDKMGVACCVVYEYQTNRYKIFGDSEDDLFALRARIESADRISGYNIWKFDLPVIYSLHGCCATWLRDKVNDLMARIWHETPIKKGTSLDAVGRATLWRGKIDHGENAPMMYRNGEIAKLHTYCMDDVALTRELVDFVDSNGYVMAPHITPVTLRKIMLPGDRAVEALR